MSDIKTNAMFSELEAQRNDALNKVVRANGQLAIAVARAQQLEGEVAKLTEELKAKSEPKPDPETAGAS